MLCSLCSEFNPSTLPPEHGGGQAHHQSRRALEESAETCELCRIILRAAISNYQDSRGKRQGKGYWRVVRGATYFDHGHCAHADCWQGDSRSVSLVTDLGACVPASSAGYNEALRMYSCKVATWPCPIIRSKSLVAYTVMAATGHIHPVGHNMKEQSPVLEDLVAEEACTNDMPVWLYGNWWAAPGAIQRSDGSHLWLMGFGARFAPSETPFEVFNTRPEQVQLRGSSIGICCTEGTHFKDIPGRLRELQSDSQLAFRRIHKWLADCSHDHPDCPHIIENHVLPTRVIDVSSLHDTVTLHESSGQRGMYMALSHCWGTSPRLKATKESRKDLQAGIRISSLPKTFRDAITITRFFSIKYLWIDCLCIIQDDSDDWEREAARMGEVYQNSFLTISAANSTDSSSGCFPARGADSYVSPATVSLGYNTRREATGPNSHTIRYCQMVPPWAESRITLFDEWLPASIIEETLGPQIGMFGKKFDPIASQPLSSRGWTLQERLLSPRTIHYAADQLYFECESRIISEDGFEFPHVPFGLGRLIETEKIPLEWHGMPQTKGISHVVGKPAVGPHKGLRWEGGWVSLVEDFSRRLLTVDQDKLTALAGVARVVAKETGDRYLAGLWERHIYEDLAWRIWTRDEPTGFDKTCPHGDEVLHEATETSRVVTKPVKYRAPSWSWACLDAAVEFIPLCYSRLVAEMITGFTTPASLDLYGRLSHGLLVMKAPVYEVSPYTPTGDEKLRGIPVQIHLGDGRGDAVGGIQLDFPSETLEYPCYALFLDPAVALIIRCEEYEPRRGEGGKDDPAKMVPKHLLTSRNVHPCLEKNPGHGGNIPWEFKPAVRIGIGTFVKHLVGCFGVPPVEHDPGRDGEISIDDCYHVSGTESWGPVAGDDPKVRITLH